MRRFGNTFEMFKSTIKHFFCRYQRLEVEEIASGMYENSNARACTFQSYKRPNTKEDVIKMLSDCTNKENPVFRDFGIVRTIAIGKYHLFICEVYLSRKFLGIFDCVNKTWALYADNASVNEPLVVLPLVLKN